MSEAAEDLIYTIDELDGTIYVLCRNGHAVASSPWPQPLEAAYPEARRAGTMGSTEPWHISHPGPDSDQYGNLHVHDADGGKQMYDELLARVRDVKSNHPNG